MGERPEYNPYPTEETHQGTITKRLVVVFGFLAGAVGALLLRPTWGGSRLPASAFSLVKDAMLSVVPKLIRTIIKPAPFDTACPGLACGVSTALRCLAPGSAPTIRNPTFKLARLC